MDKAMPLAPQFDTAGLFAREPRLWATAAKALYQDNITFQQTYPTSILTVGFPDNSSTPYNELLNQFLGKLTRFLSAKTTIYNVQESWRTDMPTAQALPAFLNNTYELLTAKEQAKLVRDSFYREYAKTHDGRTPHVNPSALQRWAFGDNDESTIEEVVAAKTKFMNWFNDKELPRDAETCSKHLLVYVPRTPTPKYRDTYVTGPSRPFAFSTTRLSVYSGAPDMVVPVGQVSYFSGITNHIEFLPVSVDIMAAKGCDGLIFSLVQDLHAAGIVKTVKTGRTL
jgi:Asp-tRNA(Asn)/Glu-tRNA(Gln) amidotransferase A subunit family amidase